MSDDKLRDDVEREEVIEPAAPEAAQVLEPEIVDADSAEADGAGAAAAAEAETEEPAELSLEEQLAAAQAQAAEYLDGWQRARAEFANARKRLERQRVDAYGNATVDVMQKLLPVVDDFERAIENVPASIAADSWFEGVNLVQRKLMGVLEAFKIEPIAAVGEPFDPNVHEAVMQEPSDEFESQTVIRVLQTGFRMDQRVVRPALVVVAV